MKLKTEFSHYHPKTRRLFNVERCENCGNEAEAANAVHLGKDEDENDFLLIHLDHLLPEQFWDEEREKCVCDDCF